MRTRYHQQIKIIKNTFIHFITLNTFKKSMFFNIHFITLNTFKKSMFFNIHFITLNTFKKSMFFNIHYCKQIVNLLLECNAQKGFLKKGTA